MVGWWSGGVVVGWRRAGGVEAWWWSGGVVVEWRRDDGGVGVQLVVLT